MVYSITANLDHCLGMKGPCMQYTSNNTRDQTTGLCSYESASGIVFYNVTYMIIWARSLLVTELVDPSADRGVAKKPEAHPFQLVPPRRPIMVEERYTSQTSSTRCEAQ